MCNLIILKQIPNIISILRALSIFLICFALSQDALTWQWLAQVVFILAVLSDFLDGYLARRYHAISALGKVLDASVDKLFFFGLVLYFLLNGVFSFKILGVFLLLHLIRDITVTAIRCTLLKRGIEMNVLSTGQIKTVFQFIFLFLGMVISLLEFYLIHELSAVTHWIEPLTLCAYFIYGLSIILSLFSGYSYIRFYTNCNANKV